MFYNWRGTLFDQAYVMSAVHLFSFSVGSTVSTPDCCMNDFTSFRLILLCYRDFSVFVTLLWSRNIFRVGLLFSYGHAQTSHRFSFSELKTHAYRTVFLSLLWALISIYTEGISKSVMVLAFGSYAVGITTRDSLFWQVCRYFPFSRAFIFQRRSVSYRNLVVSSCRCRRSNCVYLEWMSISLYTELNYLVRCGL
jgi:hypothetical protein